MVNVVDGDAVGEDAHESWVDGEEMSALRVTEVDGNFVLSRYVYRGTHDRRRFRRSRTKIKVLPGSPFDATQLGAR